MTKYCVEVESRCLTIEVVGRDEWALLTLAEAGPKGCTPIEAPGPRWSGYVHNLRRMGVNIETRMECHKGPFPGRHARYILHARIVCLEASDAA